MGPVQCNIFLNGQDNSTRITECTLIKFGYNKKLGGVVVCCLSFRGILTDPTRTQEMSELMKVITCVCLTIGCEGNPHTSDSKFTLCECAS